jgi:DNA primase
MSGREAGTLVCTSLGDCVDDSTARIKRAIDIVALVGEYVPLTRSGAKFKGLCPFHEDHTPSLTVDPNYQSFKCWACGAGGDVFNFLQRIERIDFVEAKKRLADRAGVELERNSAGSSDSRQTIFRALAWAANWFQECLFKSDGGAAARAYLQERGFDLETAKRHGLGYSPNSFDTLLKTAQRAGIKPDVLATAGLVRRRESDGGYYDAFRGRLMFAIRDERKRVVGFGARVLPGADAQEGAKYLNSVASSAYQKSEILYGLDVALEAFRQQKDVPRRLVLMEGYTDCLAAWQAGFPFAVATCGTALTPMQLRKLRQHAETIVLMFDGDKAGERAAQRALDLFLSSDLLVRIALLPGGKDPADFIRERGLQPLSDLVDRAPDALEFALKLVVSRHDLESVEGRLEALEELLAMLAALPVATTGEQRLRFDATIGEIVGTFGADERSLRTRIDELRKRRPRTAAAVAAKTETTESAGPMDRRERQIVTWMIANPGRSAQRLHDLFSAVEVKHPMLRRLVEAVYRIYQEKGVHASCDMLRESLNDPALDAWIMQAQAEVPDDETYEQGLADIAAALIMVRRRAEIAAAKRRSAE